MTNYQKFNKAPSRTPGERKPSVVSNSGIKTEKRVVFLLPYALEYSCGLKPTVKLKNTYTRDSVFFFFFSSPPTPPTCILKT